MTITCRPGSLLAGAAALPASLHPLDAPPSPQVPGQVTVIVSLEGSRMPNEAKFLITVTTVQPVPVVVQVAGPSAPAVRVLPDHFQ